VQVSLAAKNRVAGFIAVISTAALHGEAGGNPAQAGGRKWPSRSSSEYINQRLAAAQIFSGSRLRHRSEEAIPSEILAARPSTTLC